MHEDRDEDGQGAKNTGPKAGRVGPTKGNGGDTVTEGAAALSFERVAAGPIRRTQRAFSFSRVWSARGDRKEAVADIHQSTRSVIVNKAGRVTVALMAALALAACSEEPAPAPEEESLDKLEISVDGDKDKVEVKAESDDEE